LLLFKLKLFNRLGDDGSAYGIGRAAIRSLLDADDDRCSLGTRAATAPSTTTSSSNNGTTTTDSPSPSSSSSSSTPLASHPPEPSALLPFHQDLLACIGVECPSDVIPRTYSPHADGFEASESARKLWIAQAAQAVFAHAFSPVPSPSRTEARRVAEDAIQPLVDMIEKLVADKSVVVPQRSALLLGGGLWQLEGFREVVLDGLKAKSLEFATVEIISDPAEAGALALASSV
jgi:hypothetical protein